jgi:hypothetical protein
MCYVALQNLFWLGGTFENTIMYPDLVGETSKITRITFQPIQRGVKIHN